jgi:uncharacterized coiled-coil protein SlyX
LSQSMLHREIHALEARIVRDENELARVKKQLKKLQDKLTFNNMKETMRKEAESNDNPD